MADAVKFGWWVTYLKLVIVLLFSLIWLLYQKTFRDAPAHAFVPTFLVINPKSLYPLWSFCLDRCCYFQRYWIALNLNQFLVAVLFLVPTSSCLAFALENEHLKSRLWCFAFNWILLKTVALLMPLFSLMCYELLKWRAFSTFNPRVGSVSCVSDCWLLE